VNYDVAVREWAARKLAASGYPTGTRSGPRTTLAPEDFDRASITVEYEDDGGGGSTWTGEWHDFGIQIEGTANGRTYTTFVSDPFTQVVREIAESAVPDA
jgi:hypothetical protein